MAFEPIEDDIEKLDARYGGKASYVAGADIIAGQAVTLTGDNEVSPSDTDGEECVGFATQSVSSGDSVDVNGVSTVSMARATDALDEGVPVRSNGATGEEGEVAEADSDNEFVVGYTVESIGSGDYGQVVVDFGYYTTGA